MTTDGNRRRNFPRLNAVALLLALATGLVFAQEQAPPPAAPAGQDTIPDAPSANRPPQKFPATNETVTPPPPPEVTTVPPGSAPPSGGRDELFTLTKNVNFVVVPVTVKDTSGHLVEGLTKNDFRVREDGVEQRMSFFTSDPFPLTAAVVIDLGIPEVTYDKVRDTMPALVGAFGQFDEVGIYTFGTSVQRVQDFTAATNNKFYQAMERIKKKSTARAGGVPVVGGPFGYPPSVNGRPLDPGQNPTPSYTTREAKVLNDAILQAAEDLARVSPTRRKVIFVVSDGTEYRSNASYGEVLKFLLTNQISVYAVGVGSSAIPGYGQAQRVHLPRMGFGDILPRYAKATGGEVFSELSQSAIEQAYSRLTEEARNQYTIGYTTRATPSSKYRDIEVIVERPGLKVTAKQGYYPLPPPRQTP